MGVGKKGAEQMNTTPTEHVGIAVLFIDWKKKCAENAKMKNFLEHFANGNSESLSPQKAKNILLFMQEQARDVLREIETGKDNNVRTNAPDNNVGTMKSEGEDE